MKDRVILDLCGGSGAWSRPYLEAGYDVRLITSPEYDVRTYEPPDNVYGILAAPPCTDFARSGAQYWKAKDADGRTFASLEIITKCLMIIAMSNPVFWCLENPVGRLKQWLGTPVLMFDPYDFGDPYTKKTLLWGKFNIPKGNPVEPVKACMRGSWMMKIGGKTDATKAMRSVTPPGFAKAFFEANL